LAHLLNKALGNVNHTVRYTDVVDPGRPSHAIAMNDFAGALKSGSIESLVVLGGNPAFDAPVDLGLAEAIGKLEHSVHLSLDDNETSKLCRWHLPRAHTLESWSDVTDAQGRYGVTQPLIQPLYDGRTSAELLSLFTDEIQVKAHDMVRATADGYLSGIDKTTAWKSLLQDGLLADSAVASVHPEIEGRTLIAAVRTAASSHASELNAGNLEIAFTRDPALYDGRFANSSWLQELPDQTHLGQRRVVRSLHCGGAEHQTR
jgi:molybdopterin-containing oxidoreductase family iron-sulfur binding subunit